ncbi:Iron-dependent repressor IdeR [Candidatus Ornithobacterium hominis]|uniref:Transcriptional regulator MntR n=1 Tax=Candidatus Ornithobacterium hominis TaxID=2497989 RepID=A0A383U0W1_9FLAO|nr:metal-dependent transcriptional regulator [Candidatus Ornithobacterium hominis]MCT7904968.1 metal-dependent transcriptional regulator [Candidatus Ornithobacterium hominis]SZD73475.1 Iron-dependent repressor IdeR [Candidatus Ornithobacterium hominis]
MPSESKENYLKMLFYLNQKSPNIALTELSNALQVAKPSASEMIKKLEKDGFVASEKYKPIKLTNKGKKAAASIIRKHRLSEMFLSKFMQFGWEEVHGIAEEIEHISSEIFFDQMDKLLGFPSTDPHGSPIPDKDGNILKRNYKKLSEFPEKSTVILKGLKNSSSDFLNYLNKKDIQLNTKIFIDKIEPYDLSFTVSYKDRKMEVLSLAICEKLLVISE